MSDSPFDSRPVSEKVRVPAFSGRDGDYAIPGAVCHERAIFFQLETTVEKGLESVHLRELGDESYDVFEETRQRLFRATCQTEFDSIVAIFVKTCAARGDAQLAKAASVAIGEMAERRSKLPKDSDKGPLEDFVMPRPSNECGTVKWESIPLEEPPIVDMTDECWKWSVWETSLLKQKTAGWRQTPTVLFTAPETMPVAIFHETKCIIATIAPNGTNLHLHVDGEFVASISTAVPQSESSLSLAATKSVIAVCAHHGVYVFKGKKCVRHYMVHPIFQGRALSSCCFTASDKSTLLLGTALGCIWTVAAFPTATGGHIVSDPVVLPNVLPIRKMTHCQQEVSVCLVNEILLVPEKEALEGEPHRARGFSIPRPVDFISQNRLVVVFSKYGYLAFLDTFGEERPSIIPAPTPEGAPLGAKCRFPIPWYPAISLSPNVKLLSVLYMDGRVVVFKM